MCLWFARELARAALVSFLLTPQSLSAHDNVLRSADLSAAFLSKLSEDQERNIVERAFPKKAAKWTSDFVEQGIFVCWESVRSRFQHQRAIVRQAVADTWEKHSRLKFKGWSKCKEGSEGIRIALTTGYPEVQSLGIFLNGVPGGMKLNFKYSFALRRCKVEGIEDKCTRYIAVHEFGHAIGFAHEQLRPDTPDDCIEAKKGTMGDQSEITPWDPHSVMNYCNEEWLNAGELSKFDIIALQYIYGEK